MKANQRSLKSDAISCIVLKYLSAGINFAVTLLVASLLLPKDAGEFFWIFALNGICITLSRYGADTFLARKISTYPTLSKSQFWTRLIQPVLLRLVLSSLVSIALFLSLVGFNAERFTDGNSVLLVIFFTFSIPLLAASQIIGSCLQGLKKFKSSILAVSLIQNGLMAFILLILKPNRVYDLATIYIFSSAVSLIISFGIIRAALSDDLKSLSSIKPNQSEADLVLFPLFLVSFINILLVKVPEVWVGYTNSLDDLAVLTISMRINSICALSLISINYVCFPSLSQIYSINNLRQFSRYAQKVRFYSILICVPLFIILWSFSANILDLFGSQYSEYAIVLRVLLVGQFINVAFGPVGLILVAAGREDELNICYIISLIVLCVSLSILIPLYSITGAAVAVTISIIIQNISAARAAFKATEYNIIFK